MSNHLTSDKHISERAGVSFVLVNDLDKKCHLRGIDHDRYPFTNRPDIDKGQSCTLTVCPGLDPGTYNYKVTPLDIRSITVP